MRRRLLVLGTFGLAREVALLAKQINDLDGRWDLIGFIGSDSAVVGEDFGLGKVLGDDSWLLGQAFAADVAVGIGFPQLRAKVLAKYLQRKDQFSFPNLIHPSANLDPNQVRLGIGNVITAGCTFTCGIKVGDFNLFNLNATVGHDSVFGDNNVVNPGTNISGAVSVGDGVLLGTGCQVLQGLALGSYSVIGAGAVVTKNVVAGQTVVGIPARPIH